MQATIANSSGGNLAQYYNQADAAFAPFRFEDRQEPIIIAGFHHEWNPNSHTLLLASRLSDDRSFDNPYGATFLVGEDSATGEVLDMLPIVMNQDYRSRLEIYTAEAQQIWHASRFTTIAGARYQSGEFRINSTQINFDGNLADLFFAPVVQDVSSDFQRMAVYGYEHWQLLDSLRLIGGLSYEHLLLPENFRFAPVSAASDTSDHVLPKAGVIWTPTKSTTFRAAYAQSVGGASFDQSFQLEPAQVAGFNQSFRSLIPESLAGANTGEKFTSYGIALEHKLPTRTFLALETTLLQSKVSREDGAFILTELGGPLLGSLTERMAFREESLAVSAHQLVGRSWAFGGNYRVSHAELKDNYPEISDAAGAVNGFIPRKTFSGTLHTLDLHAIYQHPSGFFTRADGLWNRQQNGGSLAALNGADFWQCNILLGYHFARRQATATVGVLNITDQNYQLSPINLHNELPRERTLYAKLSFAF